MLTSNNIISMHRGDDISFLFLINRGSTYCPDYYTLSDNDYLLLSICEANQPFECGIIRKTFDMTANGDLETIYTVTPGGLPVIYTAKPVNITLSGDDTINILPGTYYYSLKLCHGEKRDSITETVLSRKKFTILE